MQDPPSAPDENHLQSDSDLPASPPDNERSVSPYHERASSEDDSSSAIIDEPCTPEIVRSMSPRQYKYERAQLAASGSSLVTYSSQYEFHETVLDARTEAVLRMGYFENNSGPGPGSVGRKTVSPPAVARPQGMHSSDSPSWKPRSEALHAGRPSSRGGRAWDQHRESPSPGPGKPFRPRRAARPATPPARIPHRGGSPSGLASSPEWTGATPPRGGGRLDLARYVLGMKARFASALPTGLPPKVTTLRDVQRRMDALRLKLMPHRASRTDWILHRADGLAEDIDAFLSTLRPADPAVAECSHLVMTSFVHLIQVSASARR